MPTKMLPTTGRSQTASPFVASEKSDELGLMNSFSSEPSAISTGVPSPFMTAAALNPSVLDLEPKYSWNRERSALEGKGAAGDVAGGQLHIAQQPLALGFQVELGRLVGFVDEGRDVGHEARVDRALDRNGGDHRGHDCRDGGDQREEDDHPTVQPGPCTRGPARRPQRRHLHRDEDDQDDDDQAVAAQ